MDTTNSIIQLHNPNKEGNHPHLTQKMKTSHMLNPNISDKIFSASDPNGLESNSTNARTDGAALLRL
jgi:hypothetical protein